MTTESREAQQGGSIVEAGAGRRYDVLGDQLVFKGTGARGAWSVFEIEKRPGAPTPPHTHAWDEAYYILSGAVEMMLGERVFEAGAGTFVRIPPNTVHAFTGRAAPGTRLLTLLAPAGAEAFFADLDRYASSEAPDMEKVIEIAVRHGVRPVLDGG
jgi:quercetin dioxygenase-like cupin family protein